MRINIVLQSVIIAICSIIPFSCSKPKANLSEVETVYITNQQWPKIFHANSECKGLDNYTGDLYLADLDDLFITEYHPCGYCFNISKIPTISHKNSEWIKQEQVSSSISYFWNDVKFCDDLYFLHLRVEIPYNGRVFDSWYIFDKTLTKYREEEGDVEEVLLDGDTPLIPIIDCYYAEEGVKFIRDQLSWKKAIMNVVPE